MKAAWMWCRRTPSAVLLVVQLAGILIYPFLPAEGIGHAIFGLFGLIVLGLAVVAVRMTPALSLISMALGLPVVVLTILEAVGPDSERLVQVSALFHAAFYFYTAYALIRYMFDDHVATVDELFATGACFTVVAWGFAYLFSAVQIQWPGSFTAAVAPADPRTWMELLFLSVTTLTSTGLSDVVPVQPHSRAVVMIEQLAGMLYLAMVVARMVALTTMRQATIAERRRRKSTGDAGEAS